MPHKTGIRLIGVAQNPANGFPARLLGLQDDFNVWRPANTPKLKVKLRLSMNRDPINHAVAAIKEEIPLWSNQSQENSKPSRIAYLETRLKSLAVTR